MNKQRMALALLLGMASARAVADPLQPVFDFVAAQPQDVAIQTLSIGADGRPRPALSWNAAQPMPLASCMKIVVLAAYARAVAAGNLDPNSMVTLDDWERFYLPEQDGGAHAASLRALGLPADARGHALNGGQTVTLDTLARFMIETSDNAATDVLLNRLGPATIRATAQALGLEAQGQIAPIAGMFTAWDKEGAAYLTMRPAQRRVHDWTWAAAVAHDPALREPPANSLPAADAQAEAELALAVKLHNQTPPLGSAEEYAALMARVLTGAAEFSPAELDIMRRHLGWPMRANPENAGVFKQLYAKGGSLGAGVLTNNLAFELNNGNRAVVSVFLRNVPLNDYETISQNLEGFAVAILSDPAARQKLQAALKLK